MSHGGAATLENAREIIEPIAQWLDGVIWVLHDCPVDDPAALYLESVKGAGRVVHRSWPARHWHSMNETLFTGLIEESDLCCWTDPLERPAAAFLSRVKAEIAPMMNRDGIGMLAYYGKAFLFPYRETLEYRQSPHWTLTGWSGRAVEWSQIEPDESQVRLNVRPRKRTNAWGFVSHYVRYHVSYPAGSNSALLGLDHWPGGQTEANWQRREQNRLAFRKELRQRGYPLTVEGFIEAVKDLPDWVKPFLKADKVFSDGYHHLVKGRLDVIDSHKPSDAIPLD